MELRSKSKKSFSVLSLYELSMNISHSVLKTVHILSPGAYMKLNHFSNRQVIGDKSGAFTAGAMLQDDAIDALHLLEKASNAKVKFVHVVRNPFDNLATMTLEHSTVRMRNGKHDSKV